jgi:hypothetical protein
LHVHAPVGVAGRHAIAAIVWGRRSRRIVRRSIARTSFRAARLTAVSASVRVGAFSAARRLPRAGAPPDVACAAHAAPAPRSRG